MSLKLICNACALQLGGPQEYAGAICWEEDKVIACDNCSAKAMLKPLDDYRLDIHDYWLDKLSEHRLTRKGMLIQEFGSLFAIKDMGQQVFDPHQALIEEKRALLEQARAAWNG